MNGVRKGSHFRLSTVAVDTGGEGANVVGPDYYVTISKKIRGGENSREDGEELTVIDEGPVIEPERGHPEEKVVWNDVSAHVMVMGVWNAKDKPTPFRPNKLYCASQKSTIWLRWRRPRYHRKRRKEIKEEVKEAVVASAGVQAVPAGGG